MVICKILFFVLFGIGAILDAFVDARWTKIAYKGGIDLKYINDDNWHTFKNVGLLFSISSVIPLTIYTMGLHQNIALVLLYIVYLGVAAIVLRIEIWESVYHKLRHGKFINLVMEEYHLSFVFFEKRIKVKGKRNLIIVHSLSIIFIFIILYFESFVWVK